MGRIDVCHANLTSSSLRFSLENVQPQSGLLNSESMNMESFYMRQFDEASDILTKLRLLTSQMVERRRVGLSEFESRHPITIHDGAIALEIRATIWTQRNDFGLKHDRHDVLTSFHIVMNIYIYLVLRTTAINCNYFNFQAKRLKVALEMLEPVGFRNIYPPDLLLWTLYLGGIGAGADKSWFRVQAAESSAALKAFTWDEVRAILKRFPWINQYCEPLFKAFWNELRCDQTPIVEID